MGFAIEIEGRNFETEVLQAPMPVLVDFSATWCGPCQKIAPIVEELASEYEGKAKVAKVDVDKNLELATQYSIMSVPTLIILKNGEIRKKWIGFTSKKELCEELDKVITS